MPNCRFSLAFSAEMNKTLLFIAKTSKTPLTPSAFTITSLPHDICAQMAELVDAPASGAGVCMDVEVRVLFWAPKYPNVNLSKKVRPKTFIPKPFQHFRSHNSNFLCHLENQDADKRTKAFDALEVLLVPEFSSERIRKSLIKSSWLSGFSNCVISVSPRYWAALSRKIVSC